MEQQLKQRLIGVTVIVALVVIFVPMLFDKSGERQAGTPEGMPPIPEEVVETKPIELPKSAEDMEAKDEKETIPESGYKIIPLTDEPQPAPKQKAGNAARMAQAAPVPAAGEEAPLEEDDGAAVEAAAPVGEPAEMAEASAPKAIKLEPLQDAGKVKPALPPAPQKMEVPAAKSKPAQAKPLDPAARPAEPPKAAKAAGEKSGVPSAWVVQTGSFAVESKANALVEKLRQSKYPAYIERVQGDSGTLFRVKVGPELDRGRAEQIQKQIEASVGLKGIIVPQR